MAILLDIKNYVARQRNTNDGATLDTTRDGLIQDSIDEYRELRQWTFLDKNAVLTISNDEATLPSDYNKKWKPITIWADDGTEFRRKSLPYVLSSCSSENVYALDKVNSKIIFKTDYTTVNLKYTKTIAAYSLTGSDDNTELPEYSIDAEKYLSTSKYWMSQERATGKQQLYYDLYQKAVDQDKAADKRDSKRVTHPYEKVNVGFNSRSI